MSDQLTVKSLALRCHGAKQHGDHWIAQCPAHEDKSPSLKISPGRKGIVMHCHAGCHIDDVCAGLGISKRQLFYDYREDGSAPPSESMRTLMEKLVKEHTPEPIEWNYPLDAIMWDALTSDKVPEDVWVRAMGMAGVEYPWLMRLEFDEAMQYPYAVQDGPLWTFLRPLWERLGRPDWLGLASKAFEKMNAVYREKLEEGVA